MIEFEIDSSKDSKTFKDRNVSSDLEDSNDRKCNCDILSGNSSVQAVSRVAQARTKPRKSFWLIVFVVCLCGCAYEVVSFLSVYFQYPVLIDVEVKNRGILKFPAVTICNMNRMKASYLDCVSKSWFECISDRFKPTPYTAIFLSERKVMTSFSLSATQLEKEYKLQSRKFLNSYTNLDEISRKCYGYSLHELVKNCTFNSDVCGTSDFSYFQSKQYGNSFTFNKEFEVNRIGPDFGLELDLDAQLSTYMEITQSAGLRVVIHESKEDPVPEQDGININPGYETQVSLTKTSSQRLPAPYRDRCKIYEVVNDSSSRDQSQFDCIRQCMQKTNLEMCGCINTFLPTNTPATRCDLNNTTQMSCLDGVLEYLSENGLPCECPLPCLSSSYDLKISTSVLEHTPENWGNSSLGWEVDPDCDVSKIVGRNYTIPKGYNSRSKLKSRATLKVFYRSLDHRLYSQRAMFSDSELFGHLGGQLGLWLGLSLVALFECFDYLLLLSNLIVKKNVLPIN